MTEEHKSDEHKSIAGRVTGSASVLVGLPALAGLIATSFGMPVEDVVKIVTAVGIVPAILIVGAMWAAGYVKEQAAESRRREERMVSRLDTIEDRYHNETVALARQSIEALNKNTDAYQDLHKTIVDHHQQTMLLLTRNFPGGSASMFGPVSESKIGKFVNLPEAGPTAPADRKG
jgi:hypothetical protein